MKLAGIDCQIPSNKISNEHIVDMVKFYSDSVFNEDLKILETIVRRFLNLTGIEFRFWRSKSDHPLELICNSIRRALKNASLIEKDIDLVIYSSIDRGFVEPANASFVCKAAGINKARSFDIVDACMSWATAVQVAYSFINSDDSINNVLIVNSEFPMDTIGTVLPINFTIQSIQDLDWKSPSFTLGEACSATIFTKDPTSTMHFKFIENSEDVELCSIPILNFSKLLKKENFAFSPMQFYSNGAKLLKNGLNPSIEILTSMLNSLPKNPSIIFPHAVSNKLIQEAITLSGINIPICSTFIELGNTATVSIPSAIAKYKSTQIPSMDKSAIAWIASAGMKFGAIEFKL